MKKLLPIFLSFLSAIAFAQPMVTDATNKHILEWDTNYQIETVRFFGLREYTSVDYQYIVRKNLKIVAEYFRHDDSSFLFVRWDSLRRELQKGILKLNLNFFTYDTIRIPDLLKDPTFEKGFSKDTIVANVSYRKTGRWKEVDSSGKLWLGKYIDGNREGIWECGFYFYDPHIPAVDAELMFDNFRPLSKHLFQNGNEITRFINSNFWPTIKGSWTHQSFIDSNTIIFQRGTYPRPLFSFDTNERFTSYRKPLKATSSDAIERYSASWKQDGDLIEIFENNTAKLIQVLSVTADHLILKFLKW